MKFRYVVRALGASALAVTLTAGVLGSAQARRSKVSSAQTYQLFSREQLSQSLASCRGQFPNSVPLNVEVFARERRAIGLCFDHFADIYSAQSKTPIVTVERLNRAAIQDAQVEERTNAFFPDPRLKAADRASLDDYRGSGYDRGHNAPAADQASPQGMAQCFSLADMSPQSPKNNRGVWSKVETDVRKYVLRARGDVFVYTGPLFLNRPVATVGRGQVWVPSHLFKLVYDETTHRSWAYILPNTDDARMSPPVTYDAFVQRTGYQFLRGLPLAG
jgi:endonuclease G, mitochondrial